MKALAAFLVLFATCAVAFAHSEDTLQMLFEAFKVQHNKNYATIQEHGYRYRVFKQNLDYVEETNAQNLGFKVAMNQFGDLTLEEFRSKYLSAVRPTFSSNAMIHRATVQDLPTNFDWRTKNVVTPVKNQQQCGSCWAFATVASVETAHALATGSLVSLSEQNLVDCSTQNGGCNGGLPYLAYEYIIKNGGIDTEACYPYKGYDGTCRYSVNCRGATISRYVNVTSGSESDLLSAVAVNPCAVGIYAGSLAFQFYTSGVYSQRNCPNQMSQLDHGVTVEGWGVENGQAYWLVKNSWGSGWGESGYIKMARNAGNMCGIATMAAYPVV